MRFLWKTQVRPGERRRRPEKKARRSPSNEGAASRLVLGGLWLLLFLTLSYVLIFSPFLLIEEVRVEGTENLPAQEIEAFMREELAGTWLSVVPKRSFLLQNPGALSERIAARYPLARTVTVKRLFPRTLSAEVAERAHLVLWCSGGPCYLLDEDGVAREAEQALLPENAAWQVRIVDTSADPVSLGQRVVSPEYVERAGEASARFREALGLEVGRAYEASSRFAEELRVVTEAGYALFLTTAVPLPETLADIALFLNQELSEEERGQLEYIDARTENRIYYRLRGADQETEDQESAEVQEETSEE